MSITIRAVLSGRRSPFQGQAYGLAVMCMAFQCSDDESSPGLPRAILPGLHLTTKITKVTTYSIPPNPPDCGAAPMAPAAQNGAAAAMQRSGLQRAKMTRATAISPCPLEMPSFQLPGYNTLREAPPIPPTIPPP